MIYSIYILINLVDRNRTSGESFPLMTKHRQLLVQLQVLMTLTVNNNQKGVKMHYSSNKTFLFQFFLMTSLGLATIV